MELNDFMSALTESLKKRGIPDDVIRAHMARLLPSLSEEDLAEIAAFRSAEDFTDISDCTAAALAQTVKVEIPESGNGTPHASEKPDHSAERSKTGHSVKKEKMPEIPITEEGKKRFILISALTSPLWAIAAVLYALLWIAAFAVEALSVRGCMRKHRSFRGGVRRIGIGNNIRYLHNDVRKGDRHIRDRLRYYRRGGIASRRRAALQLCDTIYAVCDKENGGILYVLSRQNPRSAPRIQKEVL